jgi:hypothetical protein
MIIVTGTKRSGTSMWMQVLKAAGYPILGEAFPHDWGDTIREANKEGFYESPLRHGINFTSNPHPRTGAFLHPSETDNMVVKVFALGLAKSDLAYVQRVVATMRSVREYAASLARLQQLERSGKLAKAERAGHAPEIVPQYEHMPAALEWWNDNYALLRDALIRRYPLHMVSYEAILAEPEAVVSETLRWLGGGDVQAASAVVRAELRTQEQPALRDGPLDGMDEAQIALCDELYARVHQRRPLDAELIDRLNDMHDQLEPIIARTVVAVDQRRRAARKAAMARSREKSE